MNSSDRIFFSPNYEYNIKATSTGLYRNYIGVNVKKTTEFRKKNNSRIFSWIFNLINVDHNPENLYYYQMKPLLLILRALGRFPFSIENECDISFKFCSFSMAYAILFYMFQTLCTCMSFWNFFTEQIKRNSDFDHFIFWASVLSFVTNNFIVPFTYWLDTPRIIKYIQKMNVVLKNFHNFGLNSDKLMVIIFGMAIISIPISLLFMVIELNILGTLNSNFLLSFAFVLISNVSLLLIWCATLQQIRTLGALLLNTVQKAVYSRNHKHAIQTIIKARKLWLQLSEVTSTIGYTFCRISLTVHISLFISFVLSTYGFISSLVTSDAKLKSHIGLILVASATFISTFFVNDAAHRAVDKVGVKFKEAILKMEVENALPNADILQKFLQTISYRPPLINFDGFLDLNRQIVVSFISNTVTYLIVLIQFRTATIGPQIISSIYSNINQTIL